MAAQSGPKERSSIMRFFHAVGRMIRNYFITIGVIVTVGWVGTIFLFVYGARHELSSHNKVTLPSGPLNLKLDLTGRVSESEPGFTDILMSRFFRSEREVSLPELRSVLRRAAKDERVAKLEISVGALSGGQAEFTELRRQLVEFQAASKKPVVALVSEAEEWLYYVASAANTIILNPASPVTIPGPTFHLVYFGEALKRLGVDIEVVRAGKYKSAFEPFVLNAPSPATREEYETMQQSLLTHIVQAVAKSRGKDEATVRGWYKRSIFTGAEALKAGMVDGIGYEDVKSQGQASAAKAAGKSGKDAEPTSQVEPTDMMLGEYASAVNGDKDQAEAGGSEGIGLIEAVGEINMTAPSGPTASEGISPREMQKRIDWAIESEEVKAVVLRVSSPGGSAIASDVIWHELKRLAAAKPLVVSMGEYAASGGYYISAPAQKIIAEPTTITGSIGVIGMLPNVKAFEEKWGVSMHVVTGSERRQMLGLGDKPTPEDKALVEATIDQVYRTFLTKVSEGRKLPLEKVEALAQGRVYTGLQAKELGLVDEIGGIQTAFNSAKTLAGLDPKKLYPVLHYNDDALDFSECLGSPLKLLRCLKQSSDTRFGPLSLVTAWGGNTVDEAAAHVAGWLKASASERALLLWPAYLSTSWH